MYFDSARNVLIYNVTDPAAFCSNVPGAVALPMNGYVAAPAHFEQLQYIRALGLPVIEPLRDYDWPHGPHIEKPMETQKVRANFLTVHRRALDLSDPGTGKTLSALWAADYMMSRATRPLRALIVGPLSSLEDTWLREIKDNFLGRRKAVVLHGSSERRRKLLREAADFYIINHDGVSVGARRSKKGGFVLEGLAKDLFERADIRLAVVDEASVYRDAYTRRSRVGRALLSTRDYLWELTGTPTPQGPMDAFGLRKLLTPDWFETKRSWQGKTMQQISQYKWVPRAGAMELVRHTLIPAIRYTLEECVDLPPMLPPEVRSCELTVEQKEKMKELKNELLLHVKGGTISAVNAAALRTKFLQIVSGAVYDDAHNAHQIDAHPRINMLLEYLEENNDKVIIFAPFTSVVTLLNDKLKDYTRSVVTGQVSFKDRSEIFDAFRKPEGPRLIIADPGTMSHSLNLAAASTIIWYAPPRDKTEVYLQANRRIRRPDQKKVQHIIQMVAHSLERTIFRRMAENSTLQDVMLDLVKQGS